MCGQLYRTGIIVQNRVGVSYYEDQDRVATRGCCSWSSDRLSESDSVWKIFWKSLKIYEAELFGVIGQYSRQIKTSEKDDHIII